MVRGGGGWGRGWPAGIERGCLCPCRLTEQTVTPARPRLQLAGQPHGSQAWTLLGADTMARVTSLSLVGPRSQLVSRADTPLAASQAWQDSGFSLPKADGHSSWSVPGCLVPLGPQGTRDPGAGKHCSLLSSVYAVLPRKGTVTGLKGKLGSGSQMMCDRLHHGLSRRWLTPWGEQLDSLPHRPRGFIGAVLPRDQNHMPIPRPDGPPPQVPGCLAPIAPSGLGEGREERRRKKEGKDEEEEEIAGR